MYESDVDVMTLFHRRILRYLSCRAHLYAIQGHEAGAYQEPCDVGTL